MNNTHIRFTLTLEKNIIAGFVKSLRIFDEFYGGH